jgi:hypothetical protein
MTLHYGRYATDFIMFVSFTRCVRRLIALFHVTFFFSHFVYPQGRSSSQTALSPILGIVRQFSCVQWMNRRLQYVQVQVGLARQYPVINYSSRFQFEDPSSDPFFQ